MQEESKAEQHKLPSDFPAALYPGAVLEQVTELDMPKGKMVEASLMIKPVTTVEKISDFYQREFRNRGYKVFNTLIHLPVTVERQRLDGQVYGPPITAIGPNISAIKQDSMVTLSVVTDSVHDRTKVVITACPRP
jgi:hypothetical protein